MREVAIVEFGGPRASATERLAAARSAGVQRPRRRSADRRRRAGDGSDPRHACRRQAELRRRSRTTRPADSCLLAPGRSEARSAVRPVKCRPCNRFSIVAYAALLHSNRLLAASRWQAADTVRSNSRAKTIERTAPPHAGRRAALPADLHAEPGRVRAQRRLLPLHAEGRKLADFTSGVLVANLGHNPTRWWQRVLAVPWASAADARPTRSEAAETRVLPAVPLTAYNARHRGRSRSLRAAARQPASASPAAAAASKSCGRPAAAKRFKRRSGPRSIADPASDMILATRYGFHGKKGLAGAVTGSEQDAERDPRVRFISFPARGVHHRSTRRSSRSTWRRTKQNSKRCGTNSAAASAA